jgi:class 3 adenylate cyclase
MGDGVLVYFGYPEAHEDDAERTVRAGLELIAAVTLHKSSVSLQSRVGIAYPKRAATLLQSNY